MLVEERASPFFLFFYMDMIKYFGKLLLLITVPVAFIVVATGVVSSFIALISYKLDGVSYDVAFQSTLGLITILMSLVALLGLIMFFVSLEDKKYKG